MHAALSTAWLKHQQALVTHTRTYTRHTHTRTHTQSVSKTIPTTHTKKCAFNPFLKLEKKLFS